MYQPGTKEYKQITHKLEKLGGNPLVDSDSNPEKLDLDFDFKAHAKQFRDLSGAVVLLADSDRGQKEWICGPDSKDNLDQPGPNYYNLVKLAAVACGYSNDEDGAQAWHMLLERDSPFFAGWYFTDPREASARYCEDLQVRFYAIRLAQIAKAGNKNELSKPDKKHGLGRPKDPDTAIRRKILREKITTPADLQVSQKRLLLFAEFDRKSCKIPGIGGTDWLPLHQDPGKSEQLKSVLETLRKDLRRR